MAMGNDNSEFVTDDDAHSHKEEEIQSDDSSANREMRQLAPSTAILFLLFFSIISSTITDFSPNFSEPSGDLPPLENPDPPEAPGDFQELAEGCNEDGSVDWENTTSNRSYWYLPFPGIRIDTHYNISFPMNETPPPILTQNITLINDDANRSLAKEYIYQEFRLNGIEINSGWNISDNPQTPELFDNRSLGKYKLDFLKQWDYVVVDEDIDNTTNTVNLTIKPNDGPLFLVAMTHDNGTIQGIYQIGKLSMWEIYERSKKEYCHKNIDSFQRIEHWGNWRSPGVIS